MNRDLPEDSVPRSDCPRPPDPEMPRATAAGRATVREDAPIRSLTRTMVKGVGVMVTTGVIARLFSLVSAPILTRLVGPSPYGILALIGTVSSLAASVALVGIDLAYARYFFAGRGDHSSAVESFCWRFALGLGLLFSMTAGIGWWRLIPSASVHRDLALMAGLTTMAAVTSVMATTRQRIRGAYARIAMATLAGTGVGILVSLLLARFWRPDSWAMLSGTLVGSILSLGILGLPRGQFLLQKSTLDSRERRGLLGLGLASMATAPMFWVINSADRWFLGLWVGAGAVGVYAFSASLGLSGMMINSAITTAWFPEVSREFEHSGECAPRNIARLWARLAGLHMVTWLAVTAAGGDLVRWLADSRFHGGANLIPWIAGGVFFSGLADLANTGLFLKKDLKPTALWWAAGATFNVAANSLVIRSFGPMGAVIVNCLTFALIAGGMIWSAQSRLYLPLPWGRLGVAALVALVAGNFLALPWSESAWRSLLLKFPVGILTGGLLGWVLAPDWMRRIFLIQRSPSLV